MNNNSLLRTHGIIGLIALISLLFCISVHAEKNPRAVYRSYWHPIYQGKRLNYCALDGKTCGLAVATRYCRIMGYHEANQAIIAYNLGDTRFIEEKASCHGWQCNGFKTIRCVSELTHKPAKGYYYRKHRYVFPRFNHHRVDWCYDGQNLCGLRAAFSFCRRMGYSKVLGYQIDKNIGASQALANQKLCLGNTCHGYTHIDCFR